MQAVLAAVALAAGATQGPGGKPQDGFWKPEKVQFDGTDQLPDSKARDQIMLVTAGPEYRVYVVTDPKAGKAVRLFAADFRPDPAAGTFEMEVKEGQKKGLRVHGIYDLAGGKLKLCYGPADKPRPAKFEAPAGSGLFNEVWAYLDPQPKSPN